MAKREEIGYITVDAGIVYLGDPCYQREDSDFSDWDKFCDRINDKTGVTKLDDAGKGIVVSSGYGDGVYPVFIKRDEFGIITELIVKFI